VRLAALNLKGISEGGGGVDLVISESESVISENLGFHLNSRILTFTLMLPSYVNYVGFVIWSPGLSHASGFEHPASTLPTRFPAALGIGHGLPAA